MFWIHCGQLILMIVFFSLIIDIDSTAKREADYTLDDSIWNEETPVGEVERLLRQYQQNEELVKNIGDHFYQIIYPVQLRHHEKMGISTREAGIPRFPQKGYGDGEMYPSSRPRPKAGKHYHRTSLLIKAFNYRFRLDLELNTQLLAPNLVQRDYLAQGAEQVSKAEIEHCYYQGTVRDYPGAIAAFHTCNGVSGVIHLGNETFVIHPFYGGDMTKHPHVIFEARTKSTTGCGNLEKFGSHRIRRQKHGFFPFIDSQNERSKRDVREVTKYIETAIFIDKSMFEKRNGSLRAEVVHDIIQVANIADLYFRTLNTRVSVVYIETWQGGDRIRDEPDIGKRLSEFNGYKMRNLQIVHDTAQLLTAQSFKGGESGYAVSDSVCTNKAVGISVDHNVYEPHLLAGTMAHMIGHNIGMHHDDNREDCRCSDWHGCIMAKSIVGLDNVQPYKFSECSNTDYTTALKNGASVCLLNKPNEIDLGRLCGNRVIDEGEQCDCGSVEDCKTLDPCCDAYTCKLTSEAECASGPCCQNCKLQQRGTVCREATNECDLTEVCTGDMGQCPKDVYKKNGHPCANGEGFCFNGTCPALNLQCEQIWGYGGTAANIECFTQFNSKGSINGHCGTDSSGHYVTCKPENVRCGLLQCQDGSKQPSSLDGEDSYSRTIISTKGQEYECKTTTGKLTDSQVPASGLVLDGTSCGENLICINQTCVNLFPYITQGKCPSNHNNHECSEHGVCNNLIKCHCDRGWSGPDCSIVQDVNIVETVLSSTDASVGSASKNKMEKKETPYENYHGSNTVYLVIMLMSVVGGVFVVFAMMALCYRKKNTIQKYDPPYTKKSSQKSYNTSSVNQHPEIAALDSVNKILKFGSMPHYRETKPPSLKSRLGVDDEERGTGVEEVVSFIDLPPNSLSKLPEKGILKKHGGYGTMTDVERTLNSLNGYHDNIIEAIRNAHRDLSGTASNSNSLLDEEAIRNSLDKCYIEGYRKVGDLRDNADNQEDLDEEDIPPCGTIRIRTLEDIIRQLEHHTTRHMSPDSEDIRGSENEAERQYRMDGSVCSESSQGSRRCTRMRDDDSRFVYARYRQPTSRSPYGTHQHGHQHGHQLHEEEGIYETADQDRGSNHRGETPDSESDQFIQAQRQLVQWTSKENIQYRTPLQPPTPPPMPKSFFATRIDDPESFQYPDSVNETNFDTEFNTLCKLNEGDDERLREANEDALGANCEIDLNNKHNNTTNDEISMEDNFSVDCNIHDTPESINSKSISNTSDNENTALLPSTHFPEYKH